MLRDLDTFDHINNAVYLTFVENGRVDYFREVLGILRPEDLHNIMASVTLNYRTQASYGETIRVGVRTERIGNKSLTLYYEMRADEHRLVADATTVQVAFDYENDRAILIPAEWRNRIAKYEGDPGLARELAPT